MKTPAIWERDKALEDNSMKQKNKKTKHIVIEWLKKNRLLLTVVSVFVVIVAVALAFVLMSRDNIENALDSSAKIYDNVTITIQQKRIDLETVAQAELTATEATGETTEDESESYAVTYTTTLQKDGDFYYEESEALKCYFYPKDGNTFALYYDDMQSQSTGEWVETEGESSNLKPAFDLAVLDRINGSMLEKVDGKYVPIDMDTVFYTVFNGEFKEYYKSRYIEFQFDGGKLECITARYTFNSKYQIAEEYHFAYGDASVEVPGLDTASS